jgi:methanogenic corrinoid protein MtbC1
MLESDVSAGMGSEPNIWENYLDNMIAAIINFDEKRLEEIYNDALSLYPIGMVTRNLLTPLLIELGLRWADADGSIAEEHFFSFYLRNKLGARYHHRSSGNNGPLVLLAGLPGEYHEIGLLLFALTAHESGYRIIPLGTNMPLNELAPVAKLKDCSAIILSGAIEPSVQTLSKELPALVKAVDTPVLVGGLSSVYGFDAINRAGAVPLGRDIVHGLQTLDELLS